MKKSIFLLSLSAIVLYSSCKKSNPSTTPAASISSLNCSAATFSSVLTNGVQTSNVVITIPYTGGNGGSYSNISVNSTGVTGLTAAANASNISNGNGNLILSLNGTPSSAGTASFLVSLGGKSCTVSASVNSTVGAASVTSITCGSATISGTLKENTLATNLQLSIPYVGGNGGTYSAISIASTGITGVTATATAGNLISGNGSLTLLLNGTPTSYGTISFNISIGGTSCIVKLNVTPINGNAMASLDCLNPTLSGTLTVGVNATNIPLSIPYTSGNGGAYPAKSFNSTGVTGLTASYSSGSVVNGNGTLQLLVNGTPSSKGIATFQVTLNGFFCYINVNVQKAPVTKSLIENTWWNYQKTSPFYPTHYFKSNGVYYYQKLGSYSDTGTWSWIVNDSVQIKNTKFSGNNTYSVDRLTSDSLYMSSKGTGNVTFVK